MTSKAFGAISLFLFALSTGTRIGIRRYDPESVLYFFIPPGFRCPSALNCHNEAVRATLLHMMAINYAASLAIFGGGIMFTGGKNMIGGGIVAAAAAALFFSVLFMGCCCPAVLGRSHIVDYPTSTSVVPIATPVQSEYKAIELGGDVQKKAAWLDPSEQ